MIIDDFKKDFSNLNTIEKKNQINNELTFIASLIQMKEENLKIPSALKVKKYDINTLENLNENETLDYLYENIYCIKRELITLLSLNNK